MICLLTIALSWGITNALRTQRPPGSIARRREKIRMRPIECDGEGATHV